MNAGVLAFDASGRITTLAVADFPTPFFNGGTPTGALGSLVVDAVPATLHLLGGLAYDAAGAIVVNTGSPPSTWHGGLPATDAGALCISYDQVPASWVAGIPLDAAGRVCCATPTPPFDLKAFSNAFAPAEFT